jgi:hypothetical protein
MDVYRYELLEKKNRGQERCYFVGKKEFEDIYFFFQKIFYVRDKHRKMFSRVFFRNATKHCF